MEFLLELIASGASTEKILAGYPHLTREDIAAAVEFAAHFLRDSSLVEVEISH